jgi:hypothetical protein
VQNFPLRQIPTILHSIERPSRYINSLLVHEPKPNEKHFVTIPPKKTAAFGVTLPRVCREAENSPKHSIPISAWDHLSFVPGA